MTSTSTLRRLAVWGAALTIAGCAGNTLPAIERSDAAPTHPRVKRDRDTCETCHSGSHPEIVSAWNEGPHGLNLVRCFTCHGATDQGFIPRPDTARCNGCHGEMVSSVTNDRGRTQSCFTCHDSHSLGAEGKTNPHLATQAAGAQR